MTVHQHYGIKKIDAGIPSENCAVKSHKHEKRWIPGRDVEPSSARKRGTGRSGRRRTAGYRWETYDEGAGNTISIVERGSRRARIWDPPLADDSTRQPHGSDEIRIHDGCDAWNVSGQIVYGEALRRGSDRQSEEPDCDKVRA